MNPRKAAALIRRLVEKSDNLLRENRMLETRLRLTGDMLIQVKKQLGQKFPEGYK
jgi:hypothetical protein